MGIVISTGRTNQKSETKPAINAKTKTGMMPLRGLFGFEAVTVARRSSSGGVSAVRMFGLGGGKNCHSLSTVEVIGAIIGLMRSGMSSTGIRAASASDESNSVVVFNRSSGFFFFF